MALDIEIPAHSAYDVLFVLVPNDAFPTLVFRMGFRSDCPLSWSFVTFTLSYHHVIVPSGHVRVMFTPLYPTFIEQNWGMQR